MKKTLSLLLIISAICLSCKKDKGDSPNSTNSSYQPVNKESYWKYSGVSGSAAYTSTVTMTGETLVINNRKYYK